MTEKSRLDASLEAPIGSSIPEKDTQIIQRPGWYQVLTPSIKEATVNEVIFSKLLPEEVDQRIAEAFATYKRYGLPFKWCIGPMSSPEVEAKISSRSSTNWLFRGMVIDTKHNIPTPDEVTVEKVGAQNFDEFLKVFLKGWGLEQFEASARTKLAILTQPDTIHRYYLAKIRGTPAGVAGTVLKEGYGYLVGSVVLENFRGSGIYRSLIQARLKDLPHPFAVTQAREATSAPILEKLGFETTFHAKIYRFDLEKFDQHPVPYDPRWAEQFKVEAEKIKAALGPSLTRLHHIGSTAIPGLMAKPVIDILGEAKDILEIEKNATAVEALGFESKGEYGISDRAYFSKKQPIGVHLHIFPEGHFQIEKHLLFRDYLLNHPEAVKAYQKKKEDLLKIAPDNRDHYQAGKNELIAALTEAAYLWKKR